MAARAATPIELDGDLNDEAWSGAPVISEFVQIEPVEGAPGSERTEIRIVYDDYNLYVGAALYDSGQLTSRLGRRDSIWPDADALIFFIDTYHDHRTAFRFTVNPSGSKRDEIIVVGGVGLAGGGGGGGGQGGGGTVTGTGVGDTSWDPVWDVRTSVTSEGWFAELKIPFSQLRFSPGNVQVWGMQVDRRIGRKAEHVTWSFTPRLERATVARFGHLEGISGLRTSGRLELLPFVVARAEYRRVPLSGGVEFENPFRSGSDYFADFGGDLKYRLSSNLTLDGTINPDFGQVEMDPAEINLTVFETRQQERRPFFVEGAEIFRFGGGGGFQTAQLLYTRRIGRSPEMGASSDAVYAEVPGSTTILGAMKLTGKTRGGWSIGLLESLTNREVASFVDEAGERGENVVEPLTSYLAVRARKDLNEGSSSFGFIGTSANRRLGAEEDLVRRLHSDAFTGGLDFRHEFGNRAWLLSGELTSSHVRGDSAAVARTQRASARYYQRPDATHLDYVPEATQLSGYAGRIELDKQAGAWRGDAEFSAVSPGYEVNDLGFQLNADRIDVDASIGYNSATPGPIFRRWSLRVGPNNTWNFGGDALGRQIAVNGNAQLRSYHTFGGRISRSLSTLNDRLTRGGPLARDPAGWIGNLNFNTDNRLPVTLRTFGGFATDDAGAWRWNVNANIGVRLTDAHEVLIGPSLNRTHSISQFVTAVTDATADHTFGRRYVFATLDQTTVSLTARANLTFSPNLTLEIYAEPFVSSGDYGALKELAAPETLDLVPYESVVPGEDGGYTVDPDGAGPAEAFSVSNLDFNFHSLLGNAVLRWEWRPGSTLFLVWQQARSDRYGIGDDPTAGRFDFGQQAGDLFRLEPENVFLLKVSYWFNR
jgi:hypothetical protein